MSLTKQITEDIKTAMKAKDKEALEALRAVKTAFTLAISDKGVGSELTHEEEMKIITKLVKQRKDSANVYKEQKRDDLADKEIVEANVISKYLPAQLSEAELAHELTAIIQETGASGPQDMGKVMGKASKALSGKAEGKAIAAKVKELLSK